MKKIQLISMSLAMLLSFSITIHANEVETDLEERESFNEQGDWTFDEIIDEFGDSTGEEIVKTFGTGSFSNTATSASELDTVLFFDPVNEIFYLRLLEYGDTKATYLTSDLTLDNSKSSTTFLDS